jgi:hypothetical protein
MVGTYADGSSFIVFDGHDGLQADRGVSGPVAATFHLPDVWHAGSDQASGPRRQVRRGGVRLQERAADYRVALAWLGLMLFIGAGAFAIGMTIHSEAIAQQQALRPGPIYYCATGVEMPMYEPCKEMKDQKEI